MSNRNYNASRRQGSNGRLNSSREAPRELEEDEMFLMKVVAARMDPPSEAANRSNRQQPLEFRSSQDTPPRNLPQRSYNNSFGSNPAGSTASSRRNMPQRLHNSSFDSRRSTGSSRIEDVSFDDPFMRKVVMERCNQHMRDDQAGQDQIRQPQRSLPSYSLERRHISETGIDQQHNRRDDEVDQKVQILREQDQLGQPQRSRPSYSLERRLNSEPAIDQQHNMRNEEDQKAQIRRELEQIQSLSDRPTIRSQSSHAAQIPREQEQIRSFSDHPVTGIRSPSFRSFRQTSKRLHQPGDPEPGAYAARPIAPHDGSAYSLPGAFPEAPGPMPSMDEREEGDWETFPPELANNGQQPRQDPQNHPTEAAAMDPMISRTTEVTVDASLTENTTKEEPRSKLKSSTCILILCILISTTTVVVGVVLGLQNRERTESETLSKPEAMDAFTSSLSMETMSIIEIQPISPQAKAFDWLVEDVNFVNYPLWRLQQRFALATIYFSLKGPQWTSLVGATSHGIERHTWLHYDVSECDWLPHGNSLKACDQKTGQYQHLALDQLSLFNPNEQWNDVNGVQMPPELSLLTSLESLSFSDMVLPPNTTLSDLLPTTIHEMPLLETLVLVNLPMAGTLPSELGLLPVLSTLDLTENQIRGSIPSELGHLDQLVSLHLEGNNLSGSLPSEIGLWTNLEFLHMEDNAISGTVPTQIGALTNLVFWVAENNTLTGPVPTEIGLLTNLSVLQWKDNELTGPLPSTLQKLTGLTKLNVEGNQLSGSVPKELCKLRRHGNLYLLVDCNMVVCCNFVGRA